MIDETFHLNYHHVHYLGILLKEYSWPLSMPNLTSNVFVEVDPPLPTREKVTRTISLFGIKIGGLGMERKDFSKG